MTSPPKGTAHGGRHDDAGGVWIVTGLVLGAVVYAGMVVMLVAGFTPVTPLVVIPPVLVALVAANSLVGGGRGHGRSGGRPAARGAGAPSAGGTNGSRPVGSVPSAVAAEESGDSR